MLGPPEENTATLSLDVEESNQIAAEVCKYVIHRKPLSVLLLLVHLNKNIESYIYPNSAAMPSQRSRKMQHRINPTTKELNRHLNPTR